MPLLPFGGVSGANRVLRAGDTMTGNLTLAPGAATAGKSPLKFTSGTNLTTPEEGAIEFDGSSLYYTDLTPTRHTITTNDGTQTLSNKTIVSATFSGTNTINNATLNNAQIQTSKLTQYKVNVTTKTSAYTIGTSDVVVLADATSGAFTLTLPTATSGYTYYIKKIDSSANAITVATSPNTQTIDGATTHSLSTQYASLTIVSDGSNWYVI